MKTLLCTVNMSAMFHSFVAYLSIADCAIGLRPPPEAITRRACSRMGVRFAIGLRPPPKAIALD